MVPTHGDDDLVFAETFLLFRFTSSFIKRKSVFD